MDKFFIIISEDFPNLAESRFYSKDEAEAAAEEYAQENPNSIFIVAQSVSWLKSEISSEIVKEDIN